MHHQVAVYWIKYFYDGAPGTSYRGIIERAISIVYNHALFYRAKVSLNIPQCGGQGHLIKNALGRF